MVRPSLERSENCDSCEHARYTLMRNKLTVWSVPYLVVHMGIRFLSFVASHRCQAGKTTPLHSENWSWFIMVRPFNCDIEPNKTMHALVISIQWYSPRFHALIHSYLGYRWITCFIFIICLHPLKFLVAEPLKGQKKTFLFFFSKRTNSNKIFIIALHFPYGLLRHHFQVSKKNEKNNKQ